MKKLVLGIACVCTVLSVTACTEQKVEETVTETVMEEVKPKLRHVVLFKFKEESTPEDIQRVEEAFMNLPNEISEIKSIEWGVNNSPEGLDDGLTHCFFLTFESEEDRDTYLPHPAHKAYGEIVGPHLDKVTVVDYWAKN